jgi:hypothetical protein
VGDPNAGRSLMVNRRILISAKTQIPAIEVITSLFSEKTFMADCHFMDFLRHKIIYVIIYFILCLSGAHGNVVGWGTMLQAGRSQF